MRKLNFGPKIMQYTLPGYRSIWTRLQNRMTEDSAMVGLQLLDELPAYCLYAERWTQFKLEDVTHFVSEGFDD
jgi:hypothetical protein